MAFIPTKSQVEAKTRRDTVAFAMVNAKTKNVTFSKQFVDVPQIIVTMDNGYPMPTISGITKNGFKMSWVTKGNYEGRWEAFPTESDE
jgi:hypothetical protein